MAPIVAATRIPSVSWFLQVRPQSGLQITLRRDSCGTLICGDLGIFQKSHHLITNVFKNSSVIEYWQWRFIAFPLITARCIGFILKRPLSLAIASNLILVYAVFLLYCCYVYERAPQIASIEATRIRADSTVSIGLILFTVCMLSFRVSHIYYLRPFRRLG
jgi:hypothetical protein